MEPASLVILTGFKADGPKQSQVCKRAYGDNLFHHEKKNNTVLFWGDEWLIIFTHICIGTTNGIKVQLL